MTKDLSAKVCDKRFEAGVARNRLLNRNLELINTAPLALLSYNDKPVEHQVQSIPDNC